MKIKETVEEYTGNRVLNLRVEGKRKAARPKTSLRVSQKRISLAAELPRHGFRTLEQRRARRADPTEMGLQLEAAAVTTTLHPNSPPPGRAVTGAPLDSQPEGTEM